MSISGNRLAEVETAGAKCQAAIGVDEHGFEALPTELECEWWEELRGRVVARRDGPGGRRVKTMSTSDVVMPASAATGVKTFPGGSVTALLDPSGPL